MADVPLPDPRTVATVRAALDAVRRHAIDSEDEALCVLAVVGEPMAQQALDDWIDQFADTLRAMSTAAEEHRETLDHLAPATGAESPPARSTAGAPRLTSAEDGPR